MNKNYINNGFVTNEKGDVTKVEVTDKTPEILKTENEIELIEAGIRTYDKDNAINNSDKKTAIFLSFIMLVVVGIFYMVLPPLAPIFLFVMSREFIKEFVRIHKESEAINLSKNYLQERLSAKKSHLETLKKNAKTINIPEKIETIPIESQDVNSYRNKLKAVKLLLKEYKKIKRLAKKGKAEKYFAKNDIDTNLLPNINEMINLNPSEVPMILERTK